MTNAQKLENETETSPLVVSIAMGYGHLRAAYPLAERLGTEVLHVDREPLADAEEQSQWKRTREFYEGFTRVSQIPVVGRPLGWALDTVTAIPPLFPFRDLSKPTAGAYGLDRLARTKGLGRGLLKHLDDTGAPLLTTFFAPAIVADLAGSEPVYCVVTDSDINRIWVPVDPVDSKIIYLAPSRRVVRRLKSYGVHADHIRFTGFPLPHSLLGGPGLPVLRQRLAARLARLDPQGTFLENSGVEVGRVLGELPSDQQGKPPRITYAVGGAGAQAGLARSQLKGMREALQSGAMKLTLVAGVRADVNERFLEFVHELGLDEAHDSGHLQILYEPNMDAYFPAFDQLMAETDVLWTKPSEMVFYGALGIPLVLSPPVGFHERHNRRWAVERGAGIRQRDPGTAAEHFTELFEDGTLAAMAWAGFNRLPKLGLYRILEEVGHAQRAE